MPPLPPWPKPLTSAMPPPPPPPYRPPAPPEQPQTAFGGAPAQSQQPTQAPAQRRRRNTAEAAPNGFGGQPATAASAQAPFMPAAVEQPNGGAAFGMAQGAAPDQALASTLEGLFGKK